MVLEAAVRKDGNKILSHLQLLLYVKVRLLPLMNQAKSWAGSALKGLQVGE